MAGFLAAFWMIQAVVLQTPAEDPPVAVEFDLPYREKDATDPARQRYDLFLPKDHSGFPVLIFLHGGGYGSGDRKDGIELGMALAKSGIGAAMVGYVPYSIARHPAPVQDAAKACAVIKRSMKAKGGDPDRVYLGGYSTGALIATLLATDGRYLAEEGLTLSDIAGVVALSGGYRIDSRRVGSFGSAEAMKDASPLAHVTRGHPPHLLIYAEDDIPARAKLAAEFAKALEKSGAEVEVVEAKEKDHATLFTDLVQGDPTFDKIRRFVTKKRKN